MVFTYCIIELMIGIIGKIILTLVYLRPNLKKYLWKAH